MSETDGDQNECRTDSQQQNTRGNISVRPWPTFREYPWVGFHHLRHDIVEIRPKNKPFPTYPAGVPTITGAKIPARVQKPAELLQPSLFRRGGRQHVR
jgi:hypothetical protein